MDSTETLSDWRCSRTLKGKLYRAVVRVYYYSDEDSPELAEDEGAALEAVLTHFKRPENHRMRLAIDFESLGKRPRGAPRRRCNEVIKRDVAKVGATADGARDGMRWRMIIRTVDPEKEGKAEGRDVEEEAAVVVGLEGAFHRLPGLMRETINVEDQ